MNIDFSSEVYLTWLVQEIRKVKPELGKKGGK